MSRLQRSREEADQKTVSIRLPKDVIRDAKIDAAVTDETLEAVYARRLRESFRIKPPAISKRNP